MNDRRGKKPGGPSKPGGAGKPGQKPQGIPKPKVDRSDPARLAAWNVLRDVDEHGSYANLVLSAQIARLPEERDRAFATELAYGTLRATGQLDHVLEAVSGRRPAEIDPPLLDVIRLGIYQLLHLRVPTHAAVATSVELARTVTGEGSSRFANGVLRRIAEHLDAAADESLAAQVLAPPRSHDPIGWLSLIHAHPRWIVEAFVAALDGDLVAAEAALAADNDRPKTHLVARSISRDDLQQEAVAAGLEVEPTQLSPRALVLSAGEPGALESVRFGHSGVQDEGSQLIALALAAAHAPDGPVVDLCAGPGGKASLLKAALPFPLVGVEPRTARARLVEQSLVPLDGPSVTVRADGRRAPVRPGVATRVLVDAPCSGLGSLRRRPESRWRRAASDLPGLIGLQTDLLHEALDLVATNGVVAYATCSPHLEETIAVVASVLRNRSDAELIDTPAVLGQVVGANGSFGTHPLNARMVQLWPHRDGTDAMFLSLIRKN